MTLPEELDIFKNKVLLIGDPIAIRVEEYTMFSPTTGKWSPQYRYGYTVSSYSSSADNPFDIWIAYQSVRGFGGGSQPVEYIKLVTVDEERLDRFNKFIELLAMSKI